MTAAVVIALYEKRADEVLVLRAPMVGRWYGTTTALGCAVAASPLGYLEQLKRRWSVLAPADLSVARCMPEEERRARALPLLARQGDGVGYGDPLLYLMSVQSCSAKTAVSGESPAAIHEDADVYVLHAAMAGRFYLRARPDAPAFVAVGQTLLRGQTVGLVEVMKTFTRMRYDHADLPDRAVIEAICVEDGSDVAPGTPLLQLRSES